MAISMGLCLLGTIVSIISIAVGSYKGAKTFGWIKESQRERDEREREQRMKHYFYHCEKNPDGFERLKHENFAKENAEKNLQQFQKLKASQLIEKTGL